MNNFKFIALGYLAIVLMYLPIPLFAALGYKVIPLALACVVGACLIAKKLIKSI